MWIGTITFACVSAELHPRMGGGSASTSLVAVFSAATSRFSQVTICLCGSLMDLVGAFCDVAEAVPLNRVMHLWSPTGVQRGLLTLRAIAVSVQLFAMETARLGERSACPLPTLFILRGVLYALVAATIFWPRPATELQQSFDDASFRPHMRRGSRLRGVGER